MPELPEVETIKLGLQNRIVGLKVTKIQINSAKSFIGNPGLLQGKKVLKVWRRAKILGIDLANNQTILFHLKMSGQLIWIGKSKFIGGHPTTDMKGDMPHKHTRVIFSFSDGSNLYFNDQRRFGWVREAESLQVPNISFIKKLGPEPLENSFTWQGLKNNLLKHKKTPVKVAIMDQSVVSGIGNIYASEACFLSGIDPRRKVSSLTDQEFKGLHRGALKTLRDGIKYGGSSKAHFVDAAGNKGYFLDYAFVYGRDKHPCKKCKMEIKKIQLGGRGTFFCPNCQR